MPDEAPKQPDLDLIRMVQQARMQHDRTAKPSEVPAVYWIEAKDTTGSAKPPTVRAAQWTLVTTIAQVDTLWQAVKSATENGELGYKSKVSTASRGGSSESRTICVLTGDRDDEADVNRVRERLIALGINADALTLESAHD